MTVYNQAKRRIKFIFKEFDNIIIAFSGGKDSGVLLNLCIDYIRENNLDRKISVFHIDYEAQYQMTTDYVKEVLVSNDDILNVYHICMPLRVSCATSMHQTYWTPWDEKKKNIWVRNLPPMAIHSNNNSFDFWKEGMTDYDFQEQFSTWHHKKLNAKRTACLIGIRTEESLNRWRAIHSNQSTNTYKTLPWVRKLSENVYNAYPIYDWKSSDVWIANYRNQWSYNRIYDLFYQAGVPISLMRVASPFISAAQSSLHLYKAIDPDNWGKMVGRVNGVNFTAIYGATKAMGWNKIEKPSHFTWEEYMYFLLSTLPEKTRENYLAKLETSKKFWKEKGGVLSSSVIKELKENNVSITVRESSNYKTDKKPVLMDYVDDISIKDFKLIPSYKRMCICIMKNDHLCKYMGFSLNKNEMSIRKNAINKYKNII